MTGVIQSNARACVVLAGLLGAVAILAAGSPARASTTPASCTVAPGAVDGEAVLTARVVALVNARRRSLGLRPVRIGPALSRAATWKAQHMARHRYLAHVDLPGGRSVDQRLRTCGFAGRGWGEVLAAGQPGPAAVLRAWLRSPSHRAVIDAPQWRTAGAGVARAPDGRLYWALDFGS